MCCVLSFSSMATGLMKVSGAKSLGQGFQSSHLNTSLAHKVETFGSILAAVFLTLLYYPSKWLQMYLILCLFGLWSFLLGKFVSTEEEILSTDFFKDVSFHVSFHVKFGNMRCCDFSINNPQNTCLVTWLLTWNIIVWVKYSIKKSGG